MSSIITSVALLAFGLTLVSYGANWLVGGASSLSLRLGVKPLVIGLTIVAFGTSAPELVVNLIAAFQGTPDIAVGNVVGSNIANILFILGLSTFFGTLTVQKSTYAKELPLALLAAIALWVVGSDVFLNNELVDTITRSDGLVLLMLFAVFIYYIIEMARKKPADVVIDLPEDQHSKLKSTLLIIVGLGSLIFGGHLFVKYASVLARLAGLSELLIGLTIVSIGTSLPELATSIVATRRGNSDLVIGNIIGSNIFNILWILGITAVISPLPVTNAVLTDIVVSIGVTLLLFWGIFTGNRGKLTRHEGILMLACYVGYILYIALRG